MPPASVADKNARGNPVPPGRVQLGMNGFIRLTIAAAALGTLAVAPGVGFGAEEKPSVPAAAPPPAPAVPPPIAAHADPKAPVPTNPPEQIAPPAKLHEGTIVPLPNAASSARQR